MKVAGERADKQARGAPRRRHQLSHLNFVALVRQIAGLPTPFPVKAMENIDSPEMNDYSFSPTSTRGAGAPSEPIGGAQAPRGADGKALHPRFMELSWRASSSGFTGGISPGNERGPRASRRVSIWRGWCAPRETIQRRAISMTLRACAAQRASRRAKPSSSAASAWKPSYGTVSSTRQCLVNRSSGNEVRQ